MKTKLSALFVEDSDDDAFLLARAIEKGGYSLDWQRVVLAEEMRAALNDREWDIVLLDYALPGFCGITALKILRENAPDTPAIMISGTMGEETAVEAMRAGASDYFIKGNYLRLIPAIKRELREAKIRKEKNISDLALRESEVRYRTLAGQQQVAAEIARDATAAQDVDELLNRSVTLICDRFNFYHAGIFLIDKQNKYAVLAAAPGDAGRKLLEMGHKLEVGKVGIVGHVAKTGKARIALDVGKDAVHFKQPVLPKTRSEIAIPLSVDDIVIGVLDVQSQREAAFDQQDIRVLQTIADQLAVAINKAHLLDEVQLRAQELEGLHKTALVTSSELDIDTLLNRLYDQAQQLIAPDVFFIALYEAQKEEVHFSLAMKGDEPVSSIMGLYLPMDDSGLIGWVIRHRETLVIHNLKEDTLPARLVSDSQDWPDTRTWLGVPLIVRDQVVGVVSIQFFRTYAFDDAAQRFIEALAAQAAIAIENARLFETVAERVAELESLRQASLRLTASLEPQDVFDAILDGVFELVPAMRAVHIFTYAGNRLSFRSALWSDGRRGHPVAEPRPDGLTYTVARTGELIVVPDMQVHPLYKDIPKEREWKGSIIGLPLKVSNRVIGVMNVSCRQARTFSTAELRALRLLGDQAAFVIENVKLFEQMKVERRHLALLYDMGRMFARSLDPDEILEQATKLTCKALGGVGSVILLFDEKAKLLHPTAIYDREREVSIQNMPNMSLGEGLAGWVAQEQQALIVPDVSESEHWRFIPETDENVLSAISAPIVDGAEVIGTLSVHHRQKDAFDKNHLDLLCAICQQITLAYTNAKRYQEINRLVDRLGAQQYRLESLIKELPVGVLLFDENNRLITANSLGQEYLTSLTNSVVGERVSRLGIYSLPDLFDRQDDPLPIEISSDENPRKFEAQVRSVIGGGTNEWVLAIRDVTKERKIQERVQMQDRLATVGQLAAGIAHDFNNIMAAIVIYADLLSTDPGLSGTSRQQLAVIQQQIQRASSLIRQILDFSRRSVMEQTALDLLPFIKEIEKLFKRMLPETIRTVLNYGTDEYMVFVDVTRLQQVLMNLAVNARDAMPDGGELVFDLDILHLGDADEPPLPYLTPGEWVCLSVIDTGIGISAEAQKHIFEPFFTTKSVGEGTGLGLAQVYGIVKQHGGYIDVDSQIGAGTTFSIYLPKLEEEDDDYENEEKASPIRVDGERRTVLLVEDNAATRTALQAMLEAHHFNVLIARDGLEALRILDIKQAQLDLVVSDIVMPNMSGIDLYKLVQERWPGTKMFFITGHPLEDNTQKLLSKGKIVWLQKPFSVRKFRRAICDVFEDV